MDRTLVGDGAGISSDGVMGMYLDATIVKKAYSATRMAGKMSSRFSRNTLRVGRAMNVVPKMRRMTHSMLPKSRNSAIEMTWL